MVGSRAATMVQRCRKQARWQDHPRSKLLLCPRRCLRMQQLRAKLSFFPLRHRGSWRGWSLARSLGWVSGAQAGRSAACIWPKSRPRWINEEPLKRIISRRVSAEVSLLQSIASWPRTNVPIQHCTAPPPGGQTHPRPSSLALSKTNYCRRLALRARCFFAARHSVNQLRA